jgi:hypothetical protein
MDYRADNKKLQRGVFTEPRKGQEVFKNESGLNYSRENGHCDNAAC